MAGSSALKLFSLYHHGNNHQELHQHAYRNGCAQS